MGRSEIWKGIWQKKYDLSREEPAHFRDGYDLFTPEQAKKVIRYFLKKLRLSESDEVLEVGCGAGASIQELPSCRRVCGVDYSENSIALIKQRFQGEYYVAEATKLPFHESRFDAVICFAVFLYFDSLEYAEQAVEEMIRVAKPKGRILIGDINDFGKKHIADRVRKSEASERKKNYVSAADPGHLYYAKDFFKKIAKTRDLSVTFYDEDIRELDFYTMGKYRYSLVMEKRHSKGV